ncbi:fatty acid desaturase [Steroidobacter sp. S1-65]|uniref:Fatty acid desaturase n=1 Tax=Steroidobacter gossypii TaxID=2805490 RepID=A0ABS1WVJ2_9GAMM|nr:fatty acid desaturase [Steroidobacter gossypii]MBM0104996.1 fatty acid desaturase [Steroidobacter gossypii]
MDIQFLYGILNLGFWGYVLAAFAMVQFTFMAVTLYLHRDATHRSVDLHPAVRHVFRFWLWMSSGILTRQWVAVHRKHHAACETSEDPHSPLVYGLSKVLLEGAELYRAAAGNPHLVEKYGRGAPDDWIERNLYRRHRHLGIVLMVTTDLLLFGVPGIIIVAVQMSANPLFAAGIVNGLGHHTGYRNFEGPDAARNIVPWGLLIAGEELHNNHHAFPSSAKFSIRRWELDIGWLYIRLLQAVGLARVIRIAPQPVKVAPRKHVDLEALRAVIINRMHVSREYACSVILPVFQEQVQRTRGTLNRRSRNLLIRDPILLTEQARVRLQDVLAANQELKAVYEFRERLRLLWSADHVSNEHLLQHFRECLAQAEASGIRALQDFAQTLRSYALAPTST